MTLGPAACQYAMGAVYAALEVYKWFGLLSRRSVKAGVNRTHSLCPNPGKRLIPGQPAGAHDVLLPIDLAPSCKRAWSFFSSVPGRRTECFSEAYGVGEDRAPRVHPAEGAVRILYGVGRAHDLPGGLGKLELGADAAPFVAPGGSAAGMLPFTLRANGNQSDVFCRGSAILGLCAGCGLWYNCLMSPPSWTERIDLSALPRYIWYTMDFQRLKKGL